MTERHARATRLILAVVTGCVILGGGCQESTVLDVNVPEPVPIRPVDPRWRRELPLDDRPFLDAAMTAVDEVVAVGEGGMAWRWRDGAWSREETGTTAALADIAIAPDGEVLAVGAAGTVLRREGGHWSRETVPTSADLRRLAWVGSDAWVVGSGATILRRGAEGWQAVAPPATGGLYVVGVWQNGVIVGGDDGRLWRRDGEMWSDIAGATFGNWPVTDIAVVEGRLFVTAFFLWRLDDYGWTTLFGSLLADRLFAPGDHRLFVWNSWWDQFWFDARIDAPESSDAHVIGGFTRAATLTPDDRILTLATDGGIGWFAGERHVTDPHFVNGVRQLAPLDDGYLMLGEIDRLRRGPRGGWVAAPVSADSLDAGGGTWAGSAATGIYWLQFASLYRYRDGELRLVADHVLPGSAFAVDHRGRLYLAREDGLHRLEGTTWRRELGGVGDDQDWTVQRVGDCLVAVNNGIELYLRDAEGWRLLSGYQGDRVGASDWAFDAEGRLCALGLGSYQVIDPISGAALDPVVYDLPGLTDRRVDASHVTDGEILVAAGGVGAIYRLVGPARLNRWESVAGPLDERVSALVRESDGTLIVSTSTESIYTLRP